MRRSVVRRLRDEDSGQALVEFALIVPFLLLFLVGIIEFGRGWNLHQVVTDAAREAARTAVIHDLTIDPDSVERVARNALGRAGINPDSPGVEVKLTPLASFHSTGQPISVAISVPYRLAFFGALKGWTTGESTVTLRTTFTMRNE
jgi:Flp pilus assembly protein TadG